MDVAILAGLIVANWNLIVGSGMIVLVALWGWMRRPYKTSAAVVAALFFFLL